MIPTPHVRKVAPEPFPQCRVCGGESFLIERDGPPVCLHCIKEAGVVGQATVRRSDTPPVESHDDRMAWLISDDEIAEMLKQDGNEPRDGMWR